MMTLINIEQREREKRKKKKQKKERKRAYSISYTENTRESRILESRKKGPWECLNLITLFHTECGTIITTTLIITDSGKEETRQRICFSFQLTTVAALYLLAWPAATGLHLSKAQGFLSRRRYRLEQVLNSSLRFGWEAGNWGRERGRKRNCRVKVLFTIPELDQKNIHTPLRYLRASSRVMDQCRISASSTYSRQCITNQPGQQEILRLVVCHFMT